MNDLPSDMPDLNMPDLNMPDLNMLDLKPYVDQTWGEVTEVVDLLQTQVAQVAEAERSLLDILRGKLSDTSSLDSLPSPVLGALDMLHLPATISSTIETLDLTAVLAIYVGYSVVKFGLLGALASGKIKLWKPDDKMRLQQWVSQAQLRVGTTLDEVKDRVQKKVRFD